MRETEVERKTKEEAEEKVRVLEETVQQMQGVLASVKEAASRDTPKPPGTRLTEDSGFQEGERPPRAQTFRSQSDTFVMSAINGAPEPISNSKTPVHQSLAVPTALERRQSDGPAFPTSPTSASTRVQDGPWAASCRW